jgi:hypothetical protein
MTVKYRRKVYTRITKNQAQLLYKTSVVHACPRNLRPGAPFYPNIRIDPHKCFDAVAKEATHYGCADSETGTYLAYYLITIID